MSSSIMQRPNIPNFEQFGIDITDVECDADPQLPGFPVWDEHLIEDLEDLISKETQQGTGNGIPATASSHGPQVTEQSQTAMAYPDVFLCTVAQPASTLEGAPFQNVGRAESGKAPSDPVLALTLSQHQELQLPAQTSTPQRRLLLVSEPLEAFLGGQNPGPQESQSSYEMQLPDDPSRSSMGDGDLSRSVEFDEGEASRQSIDFYHLQDSLSSPQDFSARGKKRRGRKPESGVKERWKSDAHKKAEVKRRQKIQDNIKKIYASVPSLKTHKRRTSELTAVSHAVKHLRELTVQKERLGTEYNRVLDEKQALMHDIQQCQQRLPQQGLRGDGSVTLDDRYMRLVRSRSLQNEKYWLLQCVMRPVFESYKKDVSVATPKQFQQSLMQWMDASLGLTTLRPAVISALLEISRRTSIVRQPELLRSEIQAILSESAQNIT